jgi:hypothetical protein
VTVGTLHPVVLELGVCPRNSQLTEEDEKGV